MSQCKNFTNSLLKAESGTNNVNRKVQPCVECAKCRRECDLRAARATLCAEQPRSGKRTGDLAVQLLCVEQLGSGFGRAGEWAVAAKQVWCVDFLDLHTQQPLPEAFRTVLLQRPQLQIAVRPCMADGHFIWQFQEDGKESYPKLHVLANPYGEIADRVFCELQIQASTLG